MYFGNISGPLAVLVYLVYILNFRKFILLNVGKWPIPTPAVPTLHAQHYVKRKTLLLHIASGDVNRTKTFCYIARGKGNP